MSENTNQYLKTDHPILANSQIQTQYSKTDYLQFGSEIHNIIEDELRKVCRPNAKLIDIVYLIEEQINFLTNKYAESYNLKNIQYGSAFPVGINLNNIAAHWSPTNDCPIIINKTDLITIDYGIHFDGHIIDSAFTFAYDKKHEKGGQCLQH